MRALTRRGSVVVVTPVYIIAGCAVNHFRDKEKQLSWKEKCPQNAFWFMVPGLAKVPPARAGCKAIAA